MLAVLALGHNEDNDGWTEDVNDEVNAVKEDAFDWKLSQVVFNRNSSSNVVFSPISVKFLLTLLAEAAGQSVHSGTRAELMKVLPFPGTLVVTREHYRGVLSSLAVTLDMTRFDFCFIAKVSTFRTPKRTSQSTLARKVSSLMGLKRVKSSSQSLSSTTEWILTTSTSAKKQKPRKRSISGSATWLTGKSQTSLTPSLCHRRLWFSLTQFTSKDCGIYRSKSRSRWTSSLINAPSWRKNSSTRPTPSITFSPPRTNWESCSCLMPGSDSQCSWFCPPRRTDWAKSSNFWALRKSKTSRI